MHYHKSDIAKAQLEMAVWIVLNGKDPSSAITLAGAASGIFDELVKRAGKECFIDYALRVYQAKSGRTPRRQSYAHHIETRLGVIAHKHLRPGESDTIELDLESLAVDAVMRALLDYQTLYGDNEPFAKAFFQFMWHRTDAKKLMLAYETAPEKLKPKK